MEYLTVKETAQRWGVSVRTVNMHLNAGRVAGAVRKEHRRFRPAARFFSYASYARANPSTMDVERKGFPWKTLPKTKWALCPSANSC